MKQFFRKIGLEQFLQLIPYNLFQTEKQPIKIMGGGILQIKLLLVPLRQIYSDHFVDVNKTKSTKFYNCQSLSNNFKKCQIYFDYAYRL